MILVVDSGSTKTDWISLDNNGKIIFSTQTRGMNPQVLSSSIISERIINNFDLYHNSCLLYTSPSPRDVEESRMPSSA